MITKYFCRAALLALAACGATLAPSTASAQGQSAPPDWVRRYFAAEQRGQRFAHAWLNKAKPSAAASIVGGPQAGAPGQYDLSGTFRVAVLAATYSDVTPSVSPAALDTMLFAPNGSGRRYSLAQYYREVSGGRFTVAGTVLPWMTLARPKSYYGRQHNPFIRDVLAKADSTVDWRQYDNDGPDGVPNSGDDDGYVDLAMLVHPMADGVCRTDALGGPVATGFRVSRSGVFGGSAFVTRVKGANGHNLKVEDYVIAASLHCGGSGVASVNITAHEMGHALGLPDLYDLDHSSYGVGAWDLMGYGLYLEDGRPGAMSAWTRHRLGWLTITTVSASGTLTLQPLATGRTAYRVDIPGTREYLLLENRQLSGVDGALPGSGLLVWHVDQAVLDSRLPVYGANEDENRPGIALVQADGRTDLKLRSNLGDPGDAFPGAAQTRVVNDLTRPASAPHAGGLSNIQLRNIAATGGLVTVDVLLNTPAATDPTVAMLTLAVQQLVRNSGLTAAERQQLDAQGNQDGVFNSGDILALMSRSGNLSTPAQLQAAVRGTR